MCCPVPSAHCAEPPAPSFSSSLQRARDVGYPALRYMQFPQCACAPWPLTLVVPSCQLSGAWAKNMRKRTVISPWYRPLVRGSEPTRHWVGTVVHF